MLQDTFILPTSKSHFLLPWAHTNLALQHLNHPLPVHKNLNTTSSLFYSHLPLHKCFIFRHSAEAISHELNVRCHALQLILDCCYVEVVVVKQLYDFYCISLCITLKEFMVGNAQ